MRGERGVHLLLDVAAGGGVGEVAVVVDGHRDHHPRATPTAGRKIGGRSRPEKTRISGRCLWSSANEYAPTVVRLAALEDVNQRFPPEYSEIALATSAADGARTPAATSGAVSAMYPVA